MLISACVVLVSAEYLAGLAGIFCIPTPIAITIYKPRPRGHLRSPPSQYEERKGPWGVGSADRRVHACDHDTLAMYSLGQNVSAHSSAHQSLENVWPKFQGCGFTCVS